MRISDWSSDVCSSDLRKRLRTVQPDLEIKDRVAIADDVVTDRERARHENREAIGHAVDVIGARGTREIEGVLILGQHLILSRRIGDRDRRSEEHTSELQSLMRISYAVYCLKNTTKTRLLSCKLAVFAHKNKKDRKSH